MIIQNDSATHAASRAVRTEDCWPIVKFVAAWTLPHTSKCRRVNQYMQLLLPSYLEQEQFILYPETTVTSINDVRFYFSRNFHTVLPVVRSEVGSLQTKHSSKFWWLVCQRMWMVYVVLADYHDVKAYRESKDKHPRGLDEEERPDLRVCFGWFFFGGKYRSFFLCWNLGGWHLR